MGDRAVRDRRPRIRAPNLAAFNATSGAIASFHQDLNSNGGSALVASGQTVYVGGDFTTVGGMSRLRVAAVRNVPGEAGTVLPFDVAADGAVRSLALAGDTLTIWGASSRT